MITDIERENLKHDIELIKMDKRQRVEGAVFSFYKSRLYKIYNARMVATLSCFFAYLSVPILIILNFDPQYMVYFGIGCPILYGILAYIVLKIHQFFRKKLFLKNANKMINTNEIIKVVNKPWFYYRNLLLMFIPVIGTWFLFYYANLFMAEISTNEPNRHFKFKTEDCSIIIISVAAIAAINVLPSIFITLFVLKEINIDQNWGYIFYFGCGLGLNSVIPFLSAPFYIIFYRKNLTKI